ncbi:uncharacterized protein LOC127277831 [Leptopilina boulardi]|uniref:uncharacterized protein LOC127277831 n=1 Tax=Leptopilina boulardi TaxID=63433 RepID=UPI0021F68F3B|nr:uncharacterized protein LOC127277831 [Leptopilina boulardi]
MNIQEMDQTPTKKVPLEEDCGRGKRIKKDKKLFSPETKTAKDIEKENASNLKSNVRTNRKRLLNAEQAILQEEDIENAENMIKESDKNCHAVKIRTIEKKKKLITIEKSMQTEETLQTMEEKDIKIEELERLIEGLTATPPVQESSDAQNAILSRLESLQEGQKKLLEIAENSSQNESQQFQRNSNSTRKSIVAGIAIDDALLLEAKHCRNLKDCLKCLILGYYEPENYKFLGCTKPNGISDNTEN